MKLRNPFRTRYRIRRAKNGCEYIAQYRRWWWPLWNNCFTLNFSGSVIGAVGVINKHRAKWWHPCHKINPHPAQIMAPWCNRQ